MLFERATCWTSPPQVSADISGLLVLPPWEAQPRRLADGTTGQGPADDRPAGTIAAELPQTAPSHDEGDGSAPPDPDQAPCRFVQAVTATVAREHGGGWPGGTRHYIPAAGPVPSSRFP